ncbi:MAG: hypothetical protein HFACDABA_02662 [Anaerolineales bacterium]|nr:hypothetical protein [Anaerolineales bacterium]
MNADRLSLRLVSAFILILLLTSACGRDTTPTPFRPPTESSPPTAPPPTPQADATLASIFPTQTFPPALPSATPPCLNDLTFLTDITYPDGTVVLPGSIIEKQWLIQNTGACDWNPRYSLRFVGGDSLGATETMPLYPARAGARITLSLQFTAPLFAGTYESQWQAVDPDGEFFGDAVFLLITVAQ